MRIKVKSKHKKEEEAIAAKWVEIISKLTGRSEVYEGKEVHIWTEGIVISIYTTGTLMVQGEAGPEWLTKKSTAILQELSEPSLLTSKNSVPKPSQIPTKNETSTTPLLAELQPTTSKGIVAKVPSPKMKTPEKKVKSNKELVKPNRDSLVKFKLTGRDEWRRCKIMTSQPTWKRRSKYSNYVNIIIA